VDPKTRGQGDEERDGDRQAYHHYSPREAL
jgi:hypothetical protein